MKNMVKFGLLSAATLALYGCGGGLPPTTGGGNTGGGNTGGGNTGGGNPDTATYVCGDAKITKAQILDAINKARSQARSCGINQYNAAPNINWDNRLFFAADKHSLDMATHNFFSHTGSDGSSSSQRATAQGYSWNFIAENVAAGQTSLDQVVSGWLQSPGHCKNIMDARAQDIGLSCRYDENTQYKTYWTLVLGRRF